ncbi:MAG: tetratricopeptide repeat protein [Thermoanaerobaculia bacterium]|nr:tetratricopeptide repeat protein [Thermoanaerobaculia bacterium]
MRRAFIIAFVLSGMALTACGGRRPPRQPGDQLDFGIRMAREGLWSEAYFRFQQAAGAGERDPRVLNNLAVAAEALGRFDEALEHYRRALEVAPGNREIKENYDRFVSFYDSFRDRTEDAEETAGEEREDSVESPEDRGGGGTS